jgi:hypothetical protein
MTGDVNTQGCLRYVRLVQPSDCDCRLLLPTSRSAPVSRLLGCPRYQEAQQQVVDTLPSCWYWAWACTCHLSAWAWAEFGERRAPRAASATCRPVPAEAHVERRLTRSLLQQWRHTTARAGERGNPWLWTGVHVVRVSLHEPGGCGRARAAGCCPLGRPAAQVHTVRADCRPTAHSAGSMLGPGAEPRCVASRTIVRQTY